MDDPIHLNVGQALIGKTVKNDRQELGSLTIEDVLNGALSPSGELALVA